MGYQMSRMPQMGPYALEVFDHGFFWANELWCSQGRMWGLRRASQNASGNQVDNSRQSVFFCPKGDLNQAVQGGCTQWNKLRGDSDGDRMGKGEQLQRCGKCLSGDSHVVFSAVQEHEQFQ